MQVKNEMKFVIYFKTDGNLNKLYEVNRSASGLYFHAFGNPPHFSYHESGETHFKHPALKNNPEYNIRKQRAPLNEFVGPESIISFFVLDYNARDTREYKVNPEDIVFDIKPSFGVEIILTSKDVKLPTSSERGNIQQFFKKNISPKIIMEAFNIEGRRLVEQRYRINHPDII